jgi:uncharacterized protein (DUF697 family)
MTHREELEVLFMIDEDKINHTILRWSVLSGVADINPVLGADVAGVVGCQLKMFYEVAEYYGVQVTKERFLELLSTLAAGVGGWAVTIFGATTMIKVFPGIGNVLLYWQPPVVAAFTWAMGQVLKHYFPLIKEGKTWEKREQQIAMREAWKNAKEINWKTELTNSFRFTKEESVSNVPIAPHDKTDADNNQGTVVPKLSTRQRASTGTRLIVVHDDSVETRKNNLIEAGENLPPLELVPYSEARSHRKIRMKFPVHHPQENCLYVSHPYRRICYLPEEFHPSLFDDKVSELLRLLRELGSTRIKIVVKKGYRIDTTIGGGAGIPGLAAEGKIKITKESSGEMKWEEEHDVTSSPPYFLPKGMVWYPHESDWQRVFQGRRGGSMRSWTSAVENTNDFGINAETYVGISQDLAKVLNKFLRLQLDVTGQFARVNFQRTSWEISVEFGKPKAPQM